MKKILCVLGIVVFLMGCALSMQETRIPVSQFDKAFQKAIETGVGMGYTPTYKDKENGGIDLSNKDYTIKVRFYQLSDSPNEIGVRIKGEAGEGIIDPFIGSETNKIREVIESVVPKPLGLEKETRVAE